MILSIMARITIPFVEGLAMNIFALDEDPAIAAQWHCDAHVIKMILESAQLLCSAHHVTKSPKAPPYRATHLNHPCSIWTRASTANYLWLCRLGLALCAEYSLRYGKRHKTEDVLVWLNRNTPPALKQTEIHSPFALAMPDECKVVGDPVMSYRKYYQTKREGKLGTWKIEEHRPPWWTRSL